MSGLDVSDADEVREFYEGDGRIDYGGAADIVATRYSAEEFAAAAVTAGFCVDSCEVQPVEDMEMDALYCGATRTATELESAAIR